MKKLLFTLLFSCLVGIIQAQNFQLLGGSNPDKEFVNWGTLEIYEPLPMAGGPLYFFTDFKISEDGFTESYLELSKYFNLGKIIAITGQYNAGLNKDYQIKPVYLGGLSKSFAIGNLNLTLDVMYRYQKEVLMEPGGPSFPEYTNERQHGAQTTLTFLHDTKHVQLSGYCDVWLGNNVTYYIFEPQGWWKFSKIAYLGLEWRVSNYYLLENYENYFMAGLKFNLISE